MSDQKNWDNFKDIIDGDNIVDDEKIRAFVNYICKSNNNEEDKCQESLERSLKDMNDFVFTQKTPDIQEMFVVYDMLGEMFAAEEFDFDEWSVPQLNAMIVQEFMFYTFKNDEDRFSLVNNLFTTNSSPLNKKDVQMFAKKMNCVDTKDAKTKVLLGSKVVDSLTSNKCFKAVKTAVRYLGKEKRQRLSEAIDIKKTSTIDAIAKELVSLAQSEEIEKEEEDEEDDE